MVVLQNLINRIQSKKTILNIDIIRKVSQTKTYLFWGVLNFIFPLAVEDLPFLFTLLRLDSWLLYGIVWSEDL